MLKIRNFFANHTFLDATRHMRMRHSGFSSDKKGTRGDQTSLGTPTGLANSPPVAQSVPAFPPQSGESGTRTPPLPKQMVSSKPTPKAVPLINESTAAAAAPDSAIKPVNMTGSKINLTPQEVCAKHNCPNRKKSDTKVAGCSSKESTSGGKSKKFPILITFGNPILDTTFRLNTDEIHKKHGVNVNDQYMKSTAEIEKIKADCMEATKGKVSQTIGGSSLNTAKILAALIHPDEQIMFCGSIGKDKNGELMQNLLEKKEIKAKLEIIPGQPTGNCLCLIYKEHACLIADIGAAMKYNKEHMQKSSMEDYFKNAKYIYLEGFFIIERFEACCFLLNDVCRKYGSSFIINLSAAYMISTNQKQMKVLTEGADVVVGNAEQYAELAKLFNSKCLSKTVDCLFKAHNAYNKKCKTSRSKLIVATNGPHSAELYYMVKGKVKHDTFIPPKIPTDQIVDTTGAGDAFLAGFLHMFLKEESPMKCAEFGAKVAGDIIKNVGVDLTPEFKKEHRKQKDQKSTC